MTFESRVASCGAVFEIRVCSTLTIQQVPDPNIGHVRALLFLVVQDLSIFCSELSFLLRRLVRIVNHPFSVFLAFVHIFHLLFGAISPLSHRLRRSFWVAVANKV